MIIAVAVNLSRVTHLLRRAGQLSLNDWRYLAIAVKELAIARFRHAARPTSRIIQDLQARSAHSTDVSSAPGTAMPPNTADLACRSRAIGYAAAIVPWRSDCLPQAMAADRWLRRDQMTPEFHLGVAKDEGGQLRAHAWLTCAGLTVTGGDISDFQTFPGPSFPRAEP